MKLLKVTCRFCTTVLLKNITLTRAPLSEASPFFRDVQYFDGKNAFFLDIHLNGFIEMRSIFVVVENKGIYYAL